MLKPSARLAFVCWRPLEENELDLLPLRAAGLEHLIDHTPFGFADPDTVHAILKAAGFSRVTIQAHDEAVSSGDRALSDRASAALAAMPVVVLTAARQTGKSLLAWRDSQLLRPEIC